MTPYNILEMCYRPQLSAMFTITRTNAHVGRFLYSHKGKKKRAKNYPVLIDQGRVRTTVKTCRGSRKLVRKWERETQRVWKHLLAKPAKNVVPTSVMARRREEKIRQGLLTPALR